MSSAAELDTAPNADFDTAEKVDSFLCRSALWQAGHSDAGEELRTRVSNSLPQPAHLNSNMGMGVRLQSYWPKQVYDQIKPLRIHR